ncbi:MAG: transcription antitermination factor NusB [Bacteroidia bacterium]|nr:transcription antitermination factor NusB [Bacteroidia bacterium]NNK28864.1 transcription antitermination factor NusB [Flavobacteriaceae bacterium]
MLNRRHIRVKVMQSLFSFSETEDDLKSSTKFLNESITSLYDLYLLMISTLPEIHAKTENYLKKSQQKHLATEEEKDPNMKFVRNQVLKKLRYNKVLQEELNKRKLVNWKIDDEYIDILFKETIQSDTYAKYMGLGTYSFKEDLDFVVALFKNVIAPNDKIYDYLEDKKLTWIDDLPLVNTSILKLLRKTEIDSPDSHFIPPLFKDEEDKSFGTELFTKTVENSESYANEIKTRTKNWDSERLAAMDAVLLKMAICEFLEFPTIPIKVTINEYLEIAKEYSTPKSSVFINGILDKVVSEFKADGKLNKSGRGLM